MKKKNLLFILAASIFIFTHCSVAKKAPLTGTTATETKGYTIINKGEQVTIYKYVHGAHSPKEAEKYAPTYFFSTASASELQPLSKANLKKAFPENHPFHDALDATFNSDNDLTAYDTFHKMTKLNWLLKQHG
jgi:hypothetical protein